MICEITFVVGLMRYSCANVFWFAEKKMPWRQIYDGKEWEAANAKAYGVQSIPFTLLVTRRWVEIAVVLPALSGGAILLERVTGERDAVAAFIESKEE